MSLNSFGAPPALLIAMFGVAVIARLVGPIGRRSRKAHGRRARVPLIEPVLGRVCSMRMSRSGPVGTSTLRSSAEVHGCAAAADCLNPHVLRAGQIWGEVVVRAMIWAVNDSSLASPAL